MSRADVARQIGLSRSTVSAIVSELIDDGLVKEVGSGNSRGGRRPILLALNEDAYAIGGVDIGATHVAVVLTNLRCSVLQWREAPHDVRGDPEGTIELAVALIEDVLNAGSCGRLVGLGVGVPSPVIQREPNKLSSVILPAWVGHDISSALERRFRVGVYLENDANLGALAEHWWGAGRGEEHLVYIKLATGIGAGLILNGAMYRGKTGIAGEIAHTSVEPEGPKCICGQRGCLGLVTGSGILLERVAEQLPGYPGSSLQGKQLTTAVLVDAAQTGDSLAVETIARAGHLLGIGIANLLNVIDPGLVILGGELTQAGQVLLDPLVNTARERALSSRIAPARIITTRLGERDIALGAATRVLQEALMNESILTDERSAYRGVGT